MYQQTRSHLYPLAIGYIAAFKHALNGRLKKNLVSQLIIHDKFKVTNES